MDFTRQTSRTLHDEHEAVFDACSRLERALAGRGASTPPPAGDDFRAGAVEPFLRVLDGEVMRHFAFEESALFPLLEDAGEGDIVGLLIEEHAAIRACAAAFATALDALGDPGAGDASGTWRVIRTVALELTERLVAHAQKEEMALLPALDDALDARQDFELAQRYAEGRRDLRES